MDLRHPFPDAVPHLGREPRRLEFRHWGARGGVILWEVDSQQEADIGALQRSQPNLQSEESASDFE